jgi:hypothetical protein
MVVVASAGAALTTREPTLEEPQPT